jgi:hypothetical protein
MYSTNNIEKVTTNVEIPSIIKCLKHGTEQEEESNLEDFIVNAYMN